MPINNRVVIRCIDGRLVKGLTLDFSPTKDVIRIVDPEDEKKMTEIPVSEVKAVFYVKSFEGNSVPHKEFTDESLQGVQGLKLKVLFNDGEVLFGTTNGYSAGRKGFFVIPADKSGNNERVFVFTHSTSDVQSWR